jgi:phytoene/squalene synthetase
MHPRRVGQLFLGGVDKKAGPRLDFFGRILRVADTNSEHIPELIDAFISDLEQSAFGCSDPDLYIVHLDALRK